MKMIALGNRISQFKKREDGVALVEFAIFLPLFVLSFFVIVEFSRVFFSYQGAVVGVRDAARYLARIAPAGICEGKGGVGGVLTGFYKVDDSDVNSADSIEQIVFRNMDNENSALPDNVELLAVNSTYACVLAPPGKYRQLEVPVAQVSADIRITLPLVGILELNGLPLIAPITHTVTDQSRIFGV
jgi:TadE-like protein